ncbi:hypothetical protein [Planobispora rosea]|uniref:hypothetical protein n=1 Tax=Planobispora rosea TaxID=35762 RepID=UPI00167088B5|nr:hypothetical protein [Planobispora rosea]
MQCDDIFDALHLAVYLRDRLETLEHQLLERGRAHGIALKDLAGPLGVASAQAVEQRILRARAAQRGLPRSERAERADRRRPPTRTGSREARWYDRNALKLWEAAAKLADSRREYDVLIDDELAESLLELQQKVNVMRWPLSPEGFPVMRIIAARVRLLLEDLAEDRYVVFRQELDDLLPRLAQLAAEQRAAQYDER